MSDESSDLLARFRRTRAQTLALAEPLSAEDMCVQSMPDVSPTKWHLAHTTWFFETFLLEDEPRFDEAFNFLFNSYYEQVGERHPRPKRGLLSRPALERVLDYRRDVDARLGARLESGALSAERLALVRLGIEHEQQHQELIVTDIKHVLAQNPTSPVYGAKAPAGTSASRELAWATLEGGLVDIGAEGEGFCFDNEGPRHRVYLRPFEVADRLVTCGEFEAFIADGGYRQATLWLSEGWALVQARGWEAPSYWRGSAGERRVFTLAGERELDAHEPVCHVSYAEADAFARWAGARLPTEAEWEVAAAGSALEGNFVESGALHPRATDTAGLRGLFGDVWEWTGSPYVGYPGYRAPEGAVGEYNGKFMVNQQVLRGGSCATPREHVRATYRNFFPLDARWQFSGLRLARDA